MARDKQQSHDEGEILFFLNELIWKKMFKKMVEKTIKYTYRFCIITFSGF